ncbi:MAG: T9SS type A sorting domain-containing protein [Calditrichaeota bacterium]|nr:T9SS type A sorting domain-containing protein [Calditrichota bacterium]
MMKRFYGLPVLLLIFLVPLVLQAQNYVGSDACMSCHGSADVTQAGYNIYEEYMKTGHPFKLNPVSGAPPVYPTNTSPGVPEPPHGMTWDSLSYVIGGFGWKARFVKKNGYIFTANDSAQYNLWGSGETQWVPYHKGEAKAYNYNCFKCHTTGPEPTGSWNEITPDLGTFAEPGIRCEGCHGPASDHMASATTHPPIQADSLRYHRCGDCHSRGSKTNMIPAKGGFIRHHEQYNEMQASKHNTMGLTCATCHNTHVALRYPDAAGTDNNGNPLSGIKLECENCHPNKQITFQDGSPHAAECTDCHMPNASKSALGAQLGNGWKGDVATHLWKIDTRAVGRDSMFTPDGKYVRLDDNGYGAVTLDFVCLPCHQDKTVEWAAGFALDIHTNGLVGIPESPIEIPVDFALLQNYPNPFNPTTTIEFHLPRTTRVKLAVYNTVGQEIAVLANGVLAPGKHRVTFYANDLPSGIYFYRLEAEKQIFSRKMVLMR